MPIFKYTVANKEGKELSGTIEVPDESTARVELNNLGFSILQLEELKEATAEGTASTQKFVFEALDKHSRAVTGTIPARSEEESFMKLASEYDLAVTAIWKEGATEAEISQARIAGTKKFQDALMLQQEAIKKAQQVKSLEEEKEETFTKSKIEHVLNNVNDLLKIFDADLEKDQKAEINKKINKLLRIKHSSNLNYILATAEDLLIFLQSQDKTLREKGLKDKQLELSLKTRELLDSLRKTNRPQSISEDIIKYIDNWQEEHSSEINKSRFIAFVYNLLEKIKEFFKTPPEILNIEDQIKAYNKQLIQFVLLYFKESSPEYKQKIRDSIKTVWAARKKAKAEISRIKKELRDKARENDIHFNGEPFFPVLIRELNALTGWLLGFYLVYYFIAIYLSTKDFGLSNIPKGILVYESHTFKYILTTIFLLHVYTSLKVNFFKKTIIADLILIPFFCVGSIIALLNF